MNQEKRSQRPGGRSARVRAAVHRAVTDLISERGYGNFTVGDVASRAAVADSSIYRRWGNMETLLTEVANVRLNTQSPMPDTGSLAGDLHAYAANVAREITGADGLAVLRLSLALSSNGRQGLQARDDFLAERTRQLQSVLIRARERGERPPDVLDVLDHVLAPLYIRVLFGAGHLTQDDVGGLVDRLLRCLPASETRRSSSSDRGPGSTPPP